MEVEGGMLVARVKCLVSVECLVRVKPQAPQWQQDWGCPLEQACQLATEQLLRQER